MAYFHINDPYQNEVSILCPDNELYITGLYQNQSLFHKDPSFIQRDNGLVIGVDQRFTHFYVVDKNMQIIKKLHIDWSECKEELYQSNNMQNSETYVVPLGFVGIGLIFVLIPLIWLKRKRRCK